MNHTPGPWMEGDDNRKKLKGSDYCGSATKDIFAMVRVYASDEESSHTGEEYEANKRLILAAPDTFKSLIDAQQDVMTLLDFIAEDLFEVIPDDIIKPLAARMGQRVKLAENIAGVPWEEIQG